MIIHHGCSPSSESCHVFSPQVWQKPPQPPPFLPSKLLHRCCWALLTINPLWMMFSGVHHPDLPQIICSHQANKNTYFPFRLYGRGFFNFIFLLYFFLRGEVLVKCVKHSHGTKMSTLWHQWSHLVDVRNQHGWWNETHMESINCLAMLHPQLCLLCGVWWWKVAKDPRCRKSQFGCRGSLRLQKKYVVGLKVASSC